MSTTNLALPARRERCEHVLGHKFKNPLLCAEALNATGQQLRPDETTKIANNERLAVYGHILAQAHLCELWVVAGLTKGNWDRLRKECLDGDVLATVGFVNNLDKCVMRNPGTPLVSRRMMATAVEALLGAVCRDGGKTAFQAAMSRLGLVDHELLPFV